MGRNKDIVASEEDYRRQSRLNNARLLEECRSQTTFWLKDDKLKKDGKETG